jgi:hypothetical protein
MKASRREFVAAGIGVMAPSVSIGSGTGGEGRDVVPEVLNPRQASELVRSGDAKRWFPWKLDLSPARWIWLPAGRILPNTFVLFRKEFSLSTVPSEAIAWITADSRYRLTHR